MVRLPETEYRHAVEIEKDPRSSLDVVRQIVTNNPSIVGLECHTYLFTPTGPNPEEHFTIDADRLRISTEQIETIIKNLQPGWNASFHSRVLCNNGEFRHIPMIDFAPQKSPESVQIIQSAMNEVVVPRFGGGYILETDRSYHFIGTKLLTPIEQQQFLGTALLLNHANHSGLRITDERWLGHSLELREGVSCLRFTKRNTGTVPKVIGKI